MRASHTILPRVILTAFIFILQERESFLTTGRSVMPPVPPHNIRGTSTLLAEHTMYVLQSSPLRAIRATTATAFTWEATTFCATRTSRITFSLIILTAYISIRQDQPGFTITGLSETILLRLRRIHGTSILHRERIMYA